MTAHSSILAWRIPWTEEPGGLQSMEWQRVRHDWAANNLHNFFTGLSKFHLNIFSPNTFPTCIFLIPGAHEPEPPLPHPHIRRDIKLLVVVPITVNTLSKASERFDLLQLTHSYPSPHITQKKKKIQFRPHLLSSDTCSNPTSGHISGGNVRSSPVHWGLPLHGF